MVFEKIWVDEMRWIKLRKKLPGGYVWEEQIARRESRRGRALGGMLMGIRKQIMEKGSRIETEKEGIIAGVVKIGKERWIVVGVHVNRGMERTL